MKKNIQNQKRRVKFLAEYVPGAKKVRLSMGIEENELNVIFLQKFVKKKQLLSISLASRKFFNLFQQRDHFQQIILRRK